GVGVRLCEDHRDPPANQFGGERRQLIVLLADAKLDGQVAAFGIAQLVQALAKPGQSICDRCLGTQVADGRRLSRLLRPRRQRPRGSRGATKEREEGTAMHGLARHSITSSAMARMPGGTARPSAFTVLRLITNSNFVGSMTGRSAGFSPLRMRPV